MKKLEIPSLPYKYDALEPIISEEIMRLHHMKHHQGYVNKANAALDKLQKSRKGEIELDIRATLRDLSFNLNGHVLHSIFWPNMEPPTDNNKPGGLIADKINESFGSFDRFKVEFSSASKSVEGVGWGVLVWDPMTESLVVIQVEKHNLMHITESTVLLVLDVWEHAYYLQYKNDRGSYVDSWWKVVNWDNVDQRLQKIV